jgi:hypothetical protein
MSIADDIQANIENEAIADDTIRDLMDWCMDADNDGSHYFGMTYEQGIRDTLDWLAGETDHAPHKG